MNESECECSDWFGSHYWEYCESCEELHIEVKCPIHYKESR